MKLCKDCIHIRPSQNFPLVAALAHCAAAKGPEPVYGSSEMPTCHTARGIRGACGDDAVLFEAKPAEAAA